MNYRTVSILKTKKTYLQKVEKRLWDIVQLDNLLRIFINKHKDRISEWSRPTIFEKIPRNKMVIDKELQDQMFCIFKKLGFGITVGLTHKVAESISSVLALRKKRKFANLPRPNKFQYIHSYTITVGRDNVTLKGNKLIVFLGRKRDLETPKLSFKLPKFITKDNIVSDRISLKWVQNAYIELVISYKISNNIKLKFDKQKWMSIDFGYRNFAAIVSNTIPSLIVNGKPIKSFLSWFYELLSKLQSTKSWRQFRLLHKYRKNVVDAFYYNLTNTVIQICIKSHIGTIIYGKNILSIFQEKSKLNKGFNKRFRYFSFGRFISILKYKAKDLGVQVIATNEAYTSQTDPVSQKRKDFYKRQKDVLICKSGTYHADLAAAYNIAKKVMPTLKINNFKAKLTRPFKFFNISKFSNLFTANKQIKRYIQSCRILIDSAMQI